MRHLATRIGCVAVAALSLACADSLDVRNMNNPDVERAFANPQVLEQIISTGYQQIFNGIHGNTGLTRQTMAMSLESYAEIANYGMALRVAIPRGPISNQRGNQTLLENLGTFSNMQRQARIAANGIAALDKLTGAGGTLGSPVRDLRARAFGFFTLGVALGYSAVSYDSASIVTPTTSGEVVPAFSSYMDVNAAALANFDSALAIATSAVVVATPSDFTMDGASGNNWIRGTSLDRAGFIRVVHSFKARFRANVARNKAERDAVNWTEVLNDALAGITSDMIVATSSSAGWSQAAIVDMYRYTGWHAASYHIIGMADTTTGYETWINTPLISRSGFLIRTPDLRFPAGATRAAQQTASGNTPGTNGYPYFRNRPAGEEGETVSWGITQYAHYRFRGMRLDADRKFNLPEFTRAENDMLAAEAYLRQATPNIAAAAALIDRYRTAAGLPAIAGTVATLADRIPANPVGSRNCVPRVPVASGANFTTACATIWEAMKYEKRLETDFTAYTPWWLDSRGWQDLVEGTPLQFPVPYQEMDARALPFYDTGFGGAGTAWGAPVGTYGSCFGKC